MYLLIYKQRGELIIASSFTFHYVSINIMENQNRNLMNCPLHSTMYLLI